MFKARLVAQGYNLIKGIDYKFSYAGVLGTDSARALVCVGQYYGLKVFTLDFANFYLTGALDHDVFMEQPPGYEVKGKEDLVCLLKRSLYGLPESGLVAQRNLVRVMTEKAKYRQNDSEQMVFSRKVGSTHLSGGFHVDDFLGIGNDRNLFDNLITTLGDNGLKCTHGENPEKFLGISYKYYDNYVLLHQSASANKFAHDMRMDEAAPAFTPMEVGNSHLEEWIDINDARPVPVREYQVVMGEGIWLFQCRYDVCFALTICCTKMCKPTEGDVKRLKRVAKYINCTRERGLIFRRARDVSLPMISYCYVDASFGIKSISGVAMFLGRPDFETHINDSAALMVLTKIERIAVSSTMEAEMLAIERGVVALEWLAHYREEIGYPQRDPSIIFTDSLSSIKFIENTGAAPNRQTRHLRRRVAKIRENITRNMVVLKFVPGAMNCADVLTKPLGRVLHWKHCNNLQGYA
jgi:hypothetical protein